VKAAGVSAVLEIASVNNLTLFTMIVQSPSKEIVSYVLIQAFSKDYIWYIVLAYLPF